MEYDLAPMILYSQDKVRMLDFLSDVFEFEVDPITELVQSGPLSLKLIEKDKEMMESTFRPGVEFSFRIKTMEEFKEIISKYNFFLYRKSSPYTVKENFLFEENEEQKSFTITDLDGRVWRFFLEQSP